jgi:ribulose-5-phosphate 4-epimerase/fuculose-1-phosphate aldolase
MKPVALQQSAPVRSRVSEAEWEVRVNLAACYRLMAHYDMSELIYNHITARVPGIEEHFLINAYGYFYDEVTASNLYKIDLDGNVILRPDSEYDLNYAGFVIHSAVHAARKDVGCVIHSHSPASIAVSALDCGLLPVAQQAMRFYNRVGYHDYEGPATNLEERRRLAEHLGEFDVMFLRNHGTLVVGRTVPEAFNIAWYLEQGCRAQVMAMGSGAKVLLPSAESAQRVADALKPNLNDLNSHKSKNGMREWPGLLRMLDRIDPSYRE